MTDKASDVWNYMSDGISYIGNAVSGTFDKLACALHTTKSDIAGKLLIGTIGIAVAVATTAVTGGLSLGWAAAMVGGGGVYRSRNRSSHWRNGIHSHAFHG